MHNNNLTGDHAIFSEIYDHVSNCSFDPLYKGSNVHFWSKFSKILVQEFNCEVNSTYELLQTLFWTKKGPPRSLYRNLR